MTVAQVIFYLIAALAVAGALGVVLAKNAVYAALFLILALVQVLIYAGAITVLLLFALMLTRTADTPGSMTGAQWPIAAVVSILLGVLLIVTVTTSDWPGDADGTITRVLFEDLGAALFTQWAVPFEIASLVLLVALVGAIVIAREEEGE